MSNFCCELDTKTKWAGTYQGQKCGVKLEPNEQTSFVSENETYVITLISPGTYKIFVNGVYRGAGVAYLAPDCTPVLQILDPNGKPAVRYALKVDRKHRVKKFAYPQFDDRNPENYKSLYGVFRYVKCGHY